MYCSVIFTFVSALVGAIVTTTVAVAFALMAGRYIAKRITHIVWSKNFDKIGTDEYRKLNLDKITNVITALVVVMVALCAVIFAVLM